MKNSGEQIPNSNENKEQIKELEAFPIFRENDLYVAMFPEIMPLFKEGEEPSPKKIFDAIKQLSGKNVVLDLTCKESIEYAKFNDIPEELGLKNSEDSQENPTIIKYQELMELIEKSYNVNFAYEGLPIDFIISDKIEESDFSPKLVKSLLDIAKQKNNNIKKIIILVDNITDHVRNFPKDKDKVIEVLQTEIEKEFGMQPELLSDIKSVEEGDLIILDRHNSNSHSLKNKFVKQVLLLPIETELFNDKRFLEKDFTSVTGSNKDLVRVFRKEFEKKD